MKRTYGYCRVSTANQNIERQERNILASYPDAHISKEAYTGTKLTGRKELEKILKNVKEGDTIVFDSVSRMSRNSAEGFALYRQLFNQGIELVFLKEPQVNTSVYREALQKQIDISANTGDNATDKFINSIIEALKQFQMDLAEKQIQIAFDQAQKERDDLSQRTKEGIETARLNGKHIGLLEGTHFETKKSVKAKEIILKYARCFGGTLTDTEVQKLAGISRNTLYKYKKELKEEN